MVENLTHAWLTTLRYAILDTKVTHRSGINLSLDGGVSSIINDCTSFCQAGGRVILFGNGGSLATAAHIATDFGLAGWPSIALTDPVAITSHTNDFGAGVNFQKQLELLRLNCLDICVGLSCSGRSPNILLAIEHANAMGANTLTLSGFQDDNPLREAGHLNFYVPWSDYGIVQLAHEAILHMACDFRNGWKKP